MTPIEFVEMVARFSRDSDPLADVETLDRLICQAREIEIADDGLIQQLLKDCLLALNAIPNTSIKPPQFKARPKGCELLTTYDIAARLDRVLNLVTREG